jgi:hypothetical protein
VIRRHEIIARVPTIWNRTIIALHWLLEGVQDKIRSQGTILRLAVEVLLLPVLLLDVTYLSLITRRWNVYWFLMGNLVASLLVLNKASTPAEQVS